VSHNLLTYWQREKKVLEIFEGVFGKTWLRDRTADETVVSNLVDGIRVYDVRSIEALLAGEDARTAGPVIERLAVILADDSREPGSVLADAREVLAKSGRPMPVRLYHSRQAKALRRAARASLETKSPAP
jgi:hypothetical protein